jgi:hypothetical protein
MARKKSSAKPQTSNTKESQLNVINPNAAGIDLGSKEHWVCVPPESTRENIRPFGCTTPELMELADWLELNGVTSVAMESTGVEWIPLFQILSQRKFQVFLVNAKSVKTVPGRKSDLKDCQWLQQLLPLGIISSIFCAGWRNRRTQKLSSPARKSGSKCFGSCAKNAKSVNSDEFTIT